MSDNAGVLNAQEINLVDTHGRKRIQLAVVRDQPVITVYDHEGRDRVALFMADDGTPSLVFLDAAGDVQFRLYADVDTAMMTLGPKSEAGGRVTVASGTKHGGFMILHDEQGQITEGLGNLGRRMAGAE
jgi:hypothetical protein